MNIDEAVRDKKENPIPPGNQPQSSLGKGVNGGPEKLPDPGSLGDPENIVQERYDDAYQGAGGRMSKHIFLGNDRIVTKQVALGTGEDYDNADTGVERKYTYYYHADHLGSTSVVTDRDGRYCPAR